MPRVWGEKLPTKLEVEKNWEFLGIKSNVFGISPKEIVLLKERNCQKTFLNLFGWN